MINGKDKWHIWKFLSVKSDELDNLNFQLDNYNENKIIITSSYSSNCVKEIIKNVYEINVKKHLNKHKFLNNSLLTLKSIYSVLYLVFIGKNECYVYYIYYIVLEVSSSSIKNVYCGGKNRIFSKFQRKKIRFSLNFQHRFSDIHFSGVIRWI